MRWVIIVLALFLVGCSAPAVIDIPKENQRDRAIGLATDAVLSSEEYHGGSALRTTDVEQLNCLGCYKIFLTFTRDKTSVPVEVTIRDWIVQDVFYPASAYHELDTMSEDTARQMATCNTTLGSGQYNNVTKTWWFETDLKKDGCMPACVVDEFGNSEINWRCTGLKQ